MESDELTELNDLKEISVGKIKTAFNRSIDAEATHSVLWDITEKKRTTLLKFGFLVRYHKVASITARAIIMVSTLNLRTSLIIGS